MPPKTKPTTKLEPQKVRCADCRHFLRDTAGTSHTAQRPYRFFLGVCKKGQTPDSQIKQFADREKVCPIYSKNNKEV